MTACKPGDIVLVPFPFTDLSTLKRRPAVVLKWISSRTLPALAVVSMITSQIDSESIAGDVLLNEWKGGGLLHPSKVRLAKVVSIEEALIKQKIGKVGKEDWNRIKLEFKKLFSFK